MGKYRLQLNTVLRKVMRQKVWSTVRENVCKNSKKRKNRSCEMSLMYTFKPFAALPCEVQCSTVGDIFPFILVRIMYLTFNLYLIFICCTYVVWMLQTSLWHACNIMCHHHHHHHHHHHLITIEYLWQSWNHIFVSRLRVSLSDPVLTLSPAPRHMLLIISRVL